MIVSLAQSLPTLSRLEEQLYLERYGLLRPPLYSPLYPSAAAAAAAASSPYLSRFPPELLPSASLLHPSSALLHERSGQH